MLKNRSFIYSVAVMILAQPFSFSSAEDLADIIPNLYPNGIFVEARGASVRHTGHFTLDSQAAITDLNNQIAGSIRPFPVTPSAGGITYSFNPNTGMYEETSNLLGPLVSERPQTLGQGKFNLSLTYTYFEYDEFNGDDLSSIRSITRHDPNILNPDTSLFPPCNQLPNGCSATEREGFERDFIAIDFDIDLEFQSLALAGTYGVTDRLDIGVLVPFVRAELDVVADAELIVIDEENVHSDGFVGRADDAPKKNDDSATGIGDILLGAKYLWLDEADYDVSAAVRIKLETGDEDDFLGTGSTTIQPFVIGSYNLSEIAVLNGNLGVEFDLDDSDDHALVYSVGVYGGSNTITGAFDVIGRHNFGGDEQDLIDAAVGVKWRPMENFIFSANLITPLNDDGLRSDVTATVGFEYRN